MMTALTPRDCHQGLEIRHAAMHCHAMHGIRILAARSLASGTLFSLNHVWMLKLCKWLLAVCKWHLAVSIIRLHTEATKLAQSANDLCQTV